MSNIPLWSYEMVGCCLSKSECRVNTKVERKVERKVEHIERTKVDSKVESKLDPKVEHIERIERTKVENGELCEKDVSLKYTIGLISTEVLGYNVLFLEPFLSIFV